MMFLPVMLRGLPLPAWVRALPNLWRRLVAREG